MKYIRLFENFEEGHKFDLLDLFTITPKEVEELFFRELDKRNPDMENIQVFLDSGLVDVHTKDKWGNTPLYWAAAWGSLEVVELLISSGAEVNAKGYNDWTPLHLVAVRHSLAVAELLISSGAEVNAKTNGGSTPLHAAARMNSLEVAELLISSGADVNAKNNDGQTPLHRARSQEMKTLLQGVTI